MLLGNAPLGSVALGGSTATVIVAATSVVGRRAVGAPTVVAGTATISVSAVVGRRTLGNPIVIAGEVVIHTNSLYGRRTAGSAPFVGQAVLTTTVFGRRSAGTPRVGRYSQYAASIWSM